MPPSCTQDLCSRKGAFAAPAHAGPMERNVLAEPGGAVGSWPSPPDNLFGAGAVIRQEEDDRVVDISRRFQLIENVPDFNVHPMNHGGMKRHFDRLKLLLFGGQTIPRNGVADFARADLFAQALFGQIPTWHDLRIEPSERAIDKIHLFQARIPLLAQNVPTSAVAVLVKREIVGQGVQRKMGRGKS